MGVTTLREWISIGCELGSMNPSRDSSGGGLKSGLKWNLRGALEKDA